MSINCLDFFHLEAWRKGLLQLLGLFTIVDDEGVEVSAASDLELGHVVLVLLDLNRLGVLSARGQEKILDFFDFLRHYYSCTFFVENERQGRYIERKKQRGELVVQHGTGQAKDGTFGMPNKWSKR